MGTQARGFTVVRWVSLALAVGMAAFALSLPVRPAAAFATTITASNRLDADAIPSVGDTVDLGHGWVTDLQCVGEVFTETEGEVYFTYSMDDELDILGGAVSIDSFDLRCIDHLLAAPGGPLGSQPWPVEYLGINNRLKFTATVTDVRTDGGTIVITYAILAYTVRYSGGQEITDPGWTGFQRLSGELTVVFPSNGTLELYKVSSAEQLTSGNPNYSLAGARYGLYRTEADAQADENCVFVFVTDEAGRTQTTDKLDTGTYWVRELPGTTRGYQMDTAVHRVDINVGENTFTVSEKPQSDPIRVWKTSAGNGPFNPGNNVPEGGASFAGAQFRVDFYPAYFDSANQVTGTPQYSWVIQTNANGFAMVSEEYKVSGDAILHDANGDPTLPLGTAVVTEIAAPPGYLLSDTAPHLARITATGPVYLDGTEQGMVFEDQVIKGKVAVKKTLVNSAGDALEPTQLEGVRVSMVSATTGQEVCVLTLDAEGRATSPDLPYDSYRLLEVVDSLPANVEPWYVTQGLETNEPFAVAAVREAGTVVTKEFQDELKTGSLRLLKKCSDEQIAASSSIYADMTGATYGLYGSEADARADENRLFVFVCNADGTTNETNQIACGTHLWVRELTAPVSGAYLLSDQIVEVTITSIENTFTVTEAPVTGVVDVAKVDVVTGTPQGEATLAGAEVSVRYYPVFAASLDGLEGLEPEQTWTLTTDTDGRAATGVVPAGTLVLQETKAPQGYVLSDTTPHLVVIDTGGVHYLSDVGDEAVFEDQVIRGRVAVEKTLVNSAGEAVDPAVLEGVRVSVVSVTTGQAVCTLTLDAEGKAESPDLPYDTYQLVEDADSLPANVEPWYVTQGLETDEPFAVVPVHEEGLVANEAFEDELKTGSVRLLKVSSRADFTEGWTLASPEGAAYGLFATQEDARANTNCLEVLTVGADGRTGLSQQFEVGQVLYVRELAAPTSGAWRLTDQIAEVALTGYENEFEVTEEPITGIVHVAKVDVVTGDTPQGEATLAGAEVNVVYYPVFATSTADLEGLEPERTWTIVTGEDGTALTEEILAGTLVLRETKAPQGYLLSDTEPHLVVIDADGVHYLSDGGEEAEEAEEATFADEAVTARIAVEKRLLSAGGAQADPAKLAGIRIVVTDGAGNAVDTIVLGADGTGQSRPLPIGTYTLAEDAGSVPAGVQPNAWTAAGSNEDIVFATVTITETDYGRVFDTAFIDYESDTQIVRKVDADTGEGLAGAIITLYRVPDAYVTVVDGVVCVSEDFDDSDLANWEFVCQQETDSDGYVGLSMPKFGQYAWVETKAPRDYLDEARTADIDAPVPIVHPVLFDRDHASAAMSCADKHVDIAVEIVERTIAVTSAALDATDKGYQENNVGTEEYLYRISGTNKSSVDTEHFTVTMDFDDILAHDLEVTWVATPTANGDKDGSVAVHYTSGSQGEWTLWAEVDVTAPQMLSVADLLQEGDRLTGLRLDFGDVTKDAAFGTTFGAADDLIFAVKANSALTPDGPAITHAVDIYTDLAVTDETTIFATDEDNVVTVVIGPDVKQGSRVPHVPGTGDRAWTGLAGLGGAALCAVIAMGAARRMIRGRKGEDKR